MRDHTGEIGLNTVSLPQRKVVDRKYPMEVHSCAAKRANIGTAAMENINTLYAIAINRSSIDCTGFGLNSDEVVCNVLGLSNMYVIFG